MSMLPLPVVRAGDLPDEVQQMLRAGQALHDRAGVAHVLPSSFLRVDSWSQALETRLTPHFTLSELIGVDVREAPSARSFPRYVPCALVLLAAGLELFRLEVGTYVHVAANGGYRSPGHALNRHASRHCWGTAANIYRIGDTYLDSREEIEKYAAIARRVIPGAWVRPFGPQDGEADDHLHVDIGYTVFDPVNEGDGSDSTEAG
ncbi:MAG: Peptidase [Ramlibacter sp.]|nr:Peptidase [Ramlibacter sp.]